jgi:hypothetical protein
MKREEEMSTVRDALWNWDPRLTPAVAVVLLFLTIDFFSRVVIFSPDSSRPDIDEVVTLSDAIPQIGQPQLDSYLSKIAGLIKVPTQVETAQLSDELLAQQLAAEPADGYWRSEVSSFKLIAVAKSADRFVVMHRVHNVTGIGELLELREGEMIDDYVVDQISSRQLRLLAADGEIVNLILFEHDPLESAVQ